MNLDKNNNLRKTPTTKNLIYYIKYRQLIKDKIIYIVFQIFTKRIVNIREKFIQSFSRSSYFGIGQSEKLAELSHQDLKPKTMSSYHLMILCNDSKEAIEIRQEIIMDSLHQLYQYELRTDAMGDQKIFTRGEQPSEIHNPVKFKGWLPPTLSEGRFEEFLQKFLKTSLFRINYFKNTKNFGSRNGIQMDTVTEKTFTLYVRENDAKKIRKDYIDEISGRQGKFNRILIQDQRKQKIDDLYVSTILRHSDDTYDHLKSEDIAKFLDCFNIPYKKFKFWKVMDTVTFLRVYCYSASDAQKFIKNSKGKKFKSNNISYFLSSNVDDNNRLKRIMKLHLLRVLDKLTPAITQTEMSQLEIGNLKSQMDKDIGTFCNQNNFQLKFKPDDYLKNICLKMWQNEVEMQDAEDDSSKKLKYSEVISKGKEKANLDNDPEALLEYESDN